MAQVLCWMLYIYNFILPPQLCGRLGGARDYIWCNPVALLIVWAFPETTWALLFKSLVGSLWCQNWGFIKMSLLFDVGSNSESCSAKEQLRRGEKGNYVTDHWCFAFGGHHFTQSSSPPVLFYFILQPPTLRWKKQSLREPEELC